MCTLGLYFLWATYIPFLLVVLLLLWYVLAILCETRAWLETPWGHIRHFIPICGTAFIRWNSYLCLFKLPILGSCIVGFDVIAIRAHLKEFQLYILYSFCNLLFFVISAFVYFCLCVLFPIPFFCNIFFIYFFCYNFLIFSPTKRKLLYGKSSLSSFILIKMHSTIKFHSSAATFSIFLLQFQITNICVCTWIEAIR